MIFLEVFEIRSDGQDGLLQALDGRCGTSVVILCY
jgi:hypothetical protein